MQGDRVFRGAGASVTFFGRPTRFPAGPFHLAYAAGVPVVPGLVVRTGWLRYRMIVGPPMRLDASEPADVAVLASARGRRSPSSRHTCGAGPVNG